MTVTEASQCKKSSPFQMNMYTLGYITIKNLVDLVNITF